jgi:endonuclease/exonuclease/phosphatase family metal-dependent hydrolase
MPSDMTVLSDKIRDDHPWEVKGMDNSLPGPEALEHGLDIYFSRLRRFNSTRSLRASSIYKEIQKELHRVMSTVVGEQFSEHVVGSRHSLRATAWNIERGTALEGISQVLTTHPRMKDSDVLFLTELDFGMVRSNNLCVPRELARRLGCNYAYSNCYISLVKGSGLEYDVVGKNKWSLHGNALFSRHPLRKVQAIALPNGKDKMHGKEKRLGFQQAVAALVDCPGTPFWAVTLHLDAHSSQRHRFRQMKLVLDRLEVLQPSLPILIGGDWNTSTYNAKRATWAILGYVRRVLMGVQNVIDNHYPYPDRWFERNLFQELRKRGYDYESLNQPGKCTLHYNVDDVAINTNMGDWVPGWCFWFIRWALQKSGGSCSLKLDWFTGRGLKVVQPGPAVISNIQNRSDPLSDHDPIVLDFELLKQS